MKLYLRKTVEDKTVLKKIQKTMVRSNNRKGREKSVCDECAKIQQGIEANSSREKA